MQSKASKNMFNWIHAKSYRGSLRITMLENISPLTSPLPTEWVSRRTPWAPWHMYGDKDFSINDIRPAKCRLQRICPLISHMCLVKKWSGVKSAKPSWNVPKKRRASLKWSSPATVLLAHLGSSLRLDDVFPHLGRSAWATVLLMQFE